MLKDNDVDFGISTVFYNLTNPICSKICNFKYFVSGLKYIISITLILISLSQIQIISHVTVQNRN